MVHSYVAELQEKIAQERARGIYRSGGFVVGSPNPEEYAREMLALDWCAMNGEGYRVECIDPPISWEYDTRFARPYKRHLRIHWGEFPAWLGDKFRWLGMK